MFSEILIVFGMAIVTFSIRYVSFGASDRIQLSPALLNALRYVPPVVLTAIVVPEVLLHEGTLQLTVENARLVGAIAAFTVGTLTKNLLLTIITGVSAFFAWQWLLLQFVGL